MGSFRDFLNSAGTLFTWSGCLRTRMVNNGTSAAAANNGATRNVNKNFMRPIRLAIAVWVGFLALKVQAESFEEFAFDFMVQDVCVDASDKIIYGMNVTPLSESASCPRRRNLSPGELLPYHKHDWPNENEKTRAGGYQRSDSYASLMGSSKVAVQTFEFLGKEKANAMSPGDGGQIVDVAHGDASIILTQDAGGLKFFIGPNCSSPTTRSSLYHSWLLFDGQIQINRSGQAIATLRQITDLNICPNSRDYALTIWKIKDITYRKDEAWHRTEPLTTIVSEHFSRKSIDASDAMERMYMTRELGWTRWEAWANLADPKNNVERMTQRAAEFARTGRCDVSEGAPPGSGNWKMIDCREWTNLQPAANPKGDAAEFWMAYLRSNPLLKRLFSD